MNFTRNKDLIAGLDDKEKNRIIAILMSIKDVSDAKIDWEAAADRFGAGSKESMRVNSGKTLSKVKITDGSASMKDKNADAEDGHTTAAKKKTVTTPKKRKNKDDGDALDEQSPKKKASPRKKKVVAQNEIPDHPVKTENELDSES